MDLLVENGRQGIRQSRRTASFGHQAISGHQASVATSRQCLANEGQKGPGCEKWETSRVTESVPWKVVLMLRPRPLWLRMRSCIRSLQLFSTSMVLTPSGQYTRLGTLIRMPGRSLSTHVLNPIRRYNGSATVLVDSVAGTLSIAACSRPQDTSLAPTPSR